MLSNLFVCFPSVYLRSKGARLGDLLWSACVCCATVGLPIAFCEATAASLSRRVTQRFRD